MTSEDVEHMNGDEIGGEALVEIGTHVALRKDPRALLPTTDSAVISPLEASTAVLYRVCSAGAGSGRTLLLSQPDQNT
jgi:hypothetical protein